MLRFVLAKDVAIVIVPSLPTIDAEPVTSPVNWIVTAFEILFYPYTAIVVGVIANGRWIKFHEYLNDVVGRPFGG